MIHVGFVSQQKEYAGEQGKTMVEWLFYLKQKHTKLVAHHRDMANADRVFHRQVRAYGIPRIVHPGKNAEGDSPASDDDRQTKTTTVRPGAVDAFRIRDLLAETSTIFILGEDLDLDSFKLVVNSFRDGFEEIKGERRLILVRRDGTWGDDRA